MALITKQITIDGMTCVSCEDRIKRKLSSVNGISDVAVSFAKGTASFTYDSALIEYEDIVEMIELLDYKVAATKPVGEKKSNQIVGLAIIGVAMFVLINRFGGLGIFNMFPQAKQGMGYGMLFVIGLLTSLHCVAMCGGINLSQCVTRRFAQSGDGGKATTLRPSLLYNLGRVISYTIVGAIVGGIGSFVSFSGAAKGLVQLIAGIFMIIMGLNMLNIFPWLRKLNPRMPKFIAAKINSRKNSNSPLYVGLLNGLMPCGPLQAMQIYALSTGSPWKGALSMLLFSFGTVPLMFGLGALGSLLSKKFTHKMMSASAVLVVVLGIFMLSSGLSLSGFAYPSLPSSSKSGNTAVVQDNLQTITTQLSSGQYEPITVQKGIPVRWTIQAEKKNINGCNNEIIIPKFNITKKLEPGDNVIEFTPTESGAIAYSCWMGMIRSRITVVDDINNIKASGSGSSISLSIPTDNIAVAEIKDGKQYVSIDMDSTGFSPAVIVLQNGVETEWTINGKNLGDQISNIVVPEYNASIQIGEGENPIGFVPDSDFDFFSSDNTYVGYIKVVDDIKNINIDAIKTEVKNYKPTPPDLIDNSGLPSCH